MLRGDLKKLEQLAKKNAEKAAKELREEMDRPRSPKKAEKKSVDSTLDARDATKVFNEMKHKGE